VQPRQIHPFQQDPGCSDGPHQHGGVDLVEHESGRLKVAAGVVRLFDAGLLFRLIPDIPGLPS
jgi:hypothetical protein